MPDNLTIIGAGIVGVATAAYLKRDGHHVTLVDMRPPGEYCSFGNAGILSPGSCVPLATPGIQWKVPGYLMDPMGPLTIRWTYLPKRCRGCCAFWQRRHRHGWKQLPTPCDRSLSRRSMR